MIGSGGYYVRTYRESFSNSYHTSGNVAKTFIKMSKFERELIIRRQDDGLGDLLSMCHNMSITMVDVRHNITLSVYHKTDMKVTVRFTSLLVDWLWIQATPNETVHSLPVHIFILFTLVLLLNCFISVSPNFCYGDYY